MARAPRMAIGLAFLDNEILAAEVRGSGTRKMLLRAERFAFPEGCSYDAPKGLGEALGRFLRGKGFTARAAVIGLPLHWLMTKEKGVPPADAATLASLLRIQAERAFSYDGKALAIDYHAADGGQAPQSVLLFAALRERVEQAAAVAGAARLRVRSITCAATTLALATPGRSGRAADILMLVSPGSVELAMRTERGFTVLRHLPCSVGAEGDSGVGAPRIEILTSELRRVIASATEDLPGTEAGRLLVWDGVGLPEDAIAHMGEQFSLGTGGAMKLAALAETDGAFSARSDAGRFGAPAALALAASDPSLLAVDLLHSRLAPPRRRLLDRRMRLAAVGALALCVGVGAMAYEWVSAARAVESLKQEIAAQEPAVGPAEAIVGLVETAGGWYHARLSCLECLLQVSRAFPDDAGIAATQLSISEDMRGIVSGKAADDRSVIDLIARLQGSPAFSEVKLHGGIAYPRDAGRDRDLSFSVSFRFKGE